MFGSVTIMLAITIPYAALLMYYSVADLERSEIPSLKEVVGVLAGVAIMGAVALGILTVFIMTRGM